MISLKQSRCEQPIVLHMSHWQAYSKHPERKPTQDTWREQLEWPVW